MAKFRTTPNEDEIQSYMQSAAASGDLGGVDPRAVKRAESNYPKTRARGVAQVSQQIQVNQAQARQREQAASEQRRQDAQAKSVHAEADRAARQQAAQAEAVRMRNVRAAAAAGVRTTTNIETGRRDIATHPDGAPKWKAGPLGDPVQVGTQGTAIQDPQSGTVRTVPDLSLVTGGGSDGGAVSAQGTTTQAVFQQPVRDDRGNITGATPETKTDAKTGLQLFSKTDPTTGQTVKIPVGFDAEAKAKADRAAVLDRDTQAHALRANTFAQAHAAFDPRWQPVKAEYQAARAGWDKLAENSGVARDPASGKLSKLDDYGNPVPLTDFQAATHAQVMESARGRLLAAKTPYEKLSPQAENMTRVRRDLEAERLRLAEERIRLDAGLPSEDGGAAAVMAKEAGVVERTRHEEAVDEVTTPAPATLDAPIPASDKPLIPSAATPETLKPFLEAFQGLAAPETFSLGHAGNGYTMVKRGDETVGSIERSKDGTPAVVLNNNLNRNADLRQLVAFGKTGGVPIYLRDSMQRQDSAKEARWVGEVFSALQDPLNDPVISAANPDYGTNSWKQQSPSPEITLGLMEDRVRELGATPAEIARKVNTGELSVQHGEAILRDLYGTTLKAEDPLAPPTFARWLAEADADTKEQWTAARTEAEKNIVRQAFVNDWFISNRARPGVTLAMRRKAEVALMGKDGMAEKAKALGGELAQGVGSTVGMLAGMPAMFAGLGVMAAWHGRDSTEYKALELASDHFLRGGKNSLRGWEANRERWFTDEGKAKYKTLAAAQDRLLVTVETQDYYAEGVENPAFRKDYAAAVNAVTDAAYAMHAMNLEDGWEVTRDDLDPAKNPAMAKLVNGHAITGDKSLIDQYFAALLEDNGSRQAQEFMQEATTGRGKFMAGVISGAFAPPDEIAIEAASDLLTVGLGKAAFGSAKLAATTAKGAEVAATASRLGKFRAAANGLKSAFQEFGLVADSLQAPAGKLGKAWNLGAKITKVGAVGVPTEGGEELVAALHDRNATRASIAHDAVLGGLLGFFMAPMMTGPALLIQRGRESYASNQAAAKFADEWNQSGRGTDGFVPLTVEQARTAMALVPPQLREELVAKSRAAVAELSAAVTAAAKLKGMPDGSSGRVAAEKHLLQTQIQSLDSIDALAQESALRAEAVQSVQSLAPEQRDFASALAKVASGRPDLLTGAEKTAAAGRTTRDGKPYFAQVMRRDPEGNPVAADTVTDAGRAEALRDFPRIAALIQTPESVAIHDEADKAAALAAPQATAQPEVQSQPAEAPAAPALSQPVAAANPAAMDALEYSAHQQANPAAPAVGEVVQAAFANNAPVSVSMAKAAGLAAPSHYTRVGAMHVPQDAAAGPATETAASAETAPPATAAQATASPAAGVASQVKANAEAAIPRLKGKIDIVEEPAGTGGAWVASDGRIRLSVADVGQAIKRANGNAAAVAEYLQVFVERHELTHVVQFGAVRAIWEAQGKPGTFDDFFASWYGELAPELLTPAAEEIAAAIYCRITAKEWRAMSAEQKAATAWGRIPNPGLQAAEFVRMLVEARLDPVKTGEFSELFRAIKTKGAKSKIAALIRAAIDLLKGMKLTARAEEHVAMLETLYLDLTGKAEAVEAPAPASPAAAPVATGLRVDPLTGGKARVMDGEAVLWEGPADRAQAELQQSKADLVAPLRVTGDAINAALVRFPRLSGKLRAELEAAADDVMDVIAELPPGERVAAAEAAIADRINHLADAEAERTNKNRMEVIESFRAVAGKRAAQQAAGIEQAVKGSEAPAIPKGRSAERDTPGSEMRVKVTQSALDLDQLVGSSDPLFPGGALQPRNRATQASQNQREEMVNNLRDKPDQFRRYVEGVTTDAGRIVVAPLFSADGSQMTNAAGKPLFYVLSGNGRRNALEAAHSRKVAGHYQTGVREFLKSEGIDATGMALPVPVSVWVPESAKQAIDLAEYSNRDAQLAVSNTEQANRDARSIEEGNILKLWQPDATGEAAAASNRDFVKAFARAVGDEGIIDNRGNLTDEGAKRIERAMVAALLGPDQVAVLDQLFNRAGPLGLRAVLGGVASESGSLLKLATMKPDFDLSPVLANALRTAVEAKQAVANGEVADVSEFFDQGNLFESSDHTPERQLARAIVESRSRKAVREILTAYRNGAEAVDTSTVSLFAESDTTREELILKALEARPIEQVIAEVEAEFGKAADLPAKLRVVAPGIKKLSPGQRREFTAAIGAEVSRLRDGVLSAEEWQRLNPDALGSRESLFQRFLDSWDASTIQAGFGKLLSPQVQAVLGSSPYEPFRLRSRGVTLYSKSGTGVLYPDGHEVSTPASPPRSLPDGSGAFWHRLSRNGGRRALLDTWADTGNAWAGNTDDPAASRWLVKQLAKTLGDPKTVSDFWPALANSINALGGDVQGPAVPRYDPLDILDALAGLGIVGEVRTENSANPFHYAAAGPGRVLVLDAFGRVQFGKLPTAAELAAARAALAANPHKLSLYSSADVDPRIAKEFGEFTPDAYGLPPIPETLPDGHPLLVETRFKKTAVLPSDHPLVAGLPEGHALAKGLTADHPARQGGFLPAGEVSRKEFGRAVVRFFLSLGVEVPEGIQRVVYATGGGGGAGKSSILKALEARGEIDRAGAVVVNADEIKELIPEFGQFNEEGDGRGAFYVHEESSQLAKNLQDALLNPDNPRFNFIYDATLANKTKGLAMMQRWMDVGYLVHFIGVTIDPHEAMIRAVLRGKGSGRWVPPAALAEAHAGFNSAVLDYMEIADRANLYDNTPPTPTEISKKTSASEKISLVSPQFITIIKSRERDSSTQQTSQLKTDFGSGNEGGNRIEQSGGRLPQPELGQGQRSQELGGSAGETTRLASSPDQFDLFGGIEATITGPRAAIKRRAVAAAKAQPAESKAQANIAKDIGRREGLADLNLFSTAATKALAAKPARSETASDEHDLFSGTRGTGDRQPNGTPNLQPGGSGTVRKMAGEPDLFDFGAGQFPLRHGGSERSSGSDRGRGVSGDPSAGDTERGATGEAGAASLSRHRPEHPERGVGADVVELDTDGLPPVFEIPAAEEDRNARIDAADALVPKGQGAKIAANFKVLDLLRQLTAEGRNPTTEEKAQLLTYSGWGHSKSAFDDAKAQAFTRVSGGGPTAESHYNQAWRRSKEDFKRYNSTRYRDRATGIEEPSIYDLYAWNEKWGDVHRELRSRLTDAEYDAAKRSVLNAHYTTPAIIDAKWKMVEKLGFKGGRALEPGAGIGHYIGTQPEHLAARTIWSAVELDKVTSQILALLYPQARVNSVSPGTGREVTGQGFEDALIPNNSQDLIMCNVPFHETGPWQSKKEFKRELNLHNYFFARALDKVKPGGLVAFITSSSTMENNSRQRAFIASKGDLIAAVRLPNTAFKDNAGTEVTTDIIILRKPDGRKVSGHAWQQSRVVGRDTVNLKRGDQTAIQYLKGFDLEGKWLDPALEATRARWDERRLQRLRIPDANEFAAERKTADTATQEAWKAYVAAFELAESRSPNLKLEAELPIRVNEYFAANPSHAFGKHSLAGSMYRADEYTLQEDLTGGTLEQRFEGVIDSLPSDIMGRESTVKLATVKDMERGDKPFAFIERDGRIWQVGKDRLEPVEWSVGEIVVFRSWSRVKNAVRELVSAELDPLAKADEISTLRDALNREYGKHIGQFGPISKTGRGAKHDHLFEDPDFPLTAALETEERYTDRKGKPAVRYLKADIFRTRMNKPLIPPATAETVEEALTNSLVWMGYPNAPYMAKLLGRPVAEVEQEAIESELVFMDPVSGNLTIRDSYLSGFVQGKLEAARAAAEEDPAFRRNVAALEAALPVRKGISTIGVAMNSPWLPPGVLTAYMESIGLEDAKVEYRPEANYWGVFGDGNSERFSTQGASTVELIQNALEMTDPRVMNFEGSGRDRRLVHDPAASALAKTKMNAMKEDFVKWVKTSDTMIGERNLQDLVAAAFNEKANGHVPPTHEGKHITLPGASEEVYRNGIRRGAIARMLDLGCGMIAHGVGFGKTYTLIGLAMELKRLGKANRPLITVENATLQQFAASFRVAYPQANILVADSKSFEGANRRRFIARIATGDYDAIIMAHSQFNLIANNPDVVNSYINDQIAELEAARALTDSSDKRAVMALEKAKIGLENSRKEILDSLHKRQDMGLFWEDLGVDALLVDEAHRYKNAPIITRMHGLKNLPTGKASQRAIGMVLKTQSVQARMGGRGVYFATGTPISNSIAEAYIMMRFTSPELLREQGIENFDQFAAMYCTTSTGVEANWKGKIASETRFSRYINGDALMNLVGSSWDIKIDPDLAGIKRPTVKGGGAESVLVAPGPANQVFNNWVTHAVAVQWDDPAYWQSLGGRKQALEDNPWLSAVPIMTMQAGVAAALDIRMVDPNAPDFAGSKVNTAVRRILDLYKESHDRLGTQAVFTDLQGDFSMDHLLTFAGDPGLSEQGLDLPEIDADGNAVDDSRRKVKKKRQFDLFNDLRDKLIAGGIPRGEIGMIRAGMSKDARAELFDKVNAGQVRVVIGSSDTMGVGVNIQERLFALHHLMPPRDFKPSAMEQRNGRILRQGNQHYDLEVEAFVASAEESTGRKFQKEKGGRMVPDVDAAKAALEDNADALDRANKAAEKFQIRIIEYGMEKSIDSAMYSMMVAKQLGFNQVLLGKAGNSFEDPSDAITMNMAEMAARTIGDPLLIRLVELERDIRAIHMEFAGWQDDVSSARENLRKAARELNWYLGQKTRVREYSDALGSIGADETRDTVWEFGGLTIDRNRPKDAEKGWKAPKLIESLDLFLAEETSKLNHSERNLSLVEIKVDGVPFTVEIHQNLRGEVSAVGDAYWAGFRDRHEAVNFGWSSWSGAASLIANVGAMRKRAMAAPADLDATVEQLKKRIPQLERASEQTFERHDEFEALVAEQQRVQEQLAQAAAAANPTPTPAPTPTRRKPADLPPVTPANPKFMTPEVRAILARSTIEDDALTLPEALNRKLYERVNKALESAGGRWDRASGTHLFASDPRAALGLAPEAPAKLVRSLLRLETPANYPGRGLAPRETALMSSPDDAAQAAVETALDRMPPIYRQVFEAITSGASVTDVMAKHQITARAVDNILNQVRSRIASATAAAAPDGLRPRMKGGLIHGGRPDLALGAEPQVAAIDQLRNDSSLPGVRGWDEVCAQAEAMLAADYRGVHDK